MYIPEEYHPYITRVHINSLLSEARKASGGPEELTPEQRGRLIHEAARARKVIVTLVDIGALGEFGPAKKSLGNKYVIVYPVWWAYRKFAP